MSVDVKPTFDYERAIAESKSYVRDFMVENLLKDHENGKDMFLITDPIVNPSDGGVQIVTASDPDAEKFLVTVMYSFWATKDELMGEGVQSDEQKIITDPMAGKLVGVDGSVLN